MCEDCRHAEMDCCEYYGGAKEWIVVGCKKGMDANADDGFKVAFATNKPQEPKIGHCKDCKYFEYNSWANVDGIPLIVAHEICSRWGDGCKTKENGYCFLFEPKESEE